LKLFSAQRKRNALGRGYVKQIQEEQHCTECESPVKCKSIAIQTARIPNGIWHPSCFTCSICKELLVDLIYFHRDGKLFCGRHHAEIFKPRCAACDEVCCIIINDNVQLSKNSI
jgi:prickle